MNRQEIFNKLWDHFVVQGNPQSTNGNVCLYRGPNGARCAAGVVLPDEHYDPKLEGLSLRALLSDRGREDGRDHHDDHRLHNMPEPSTLREQWGVAEEDVEMLAEAQHGHDAGATGIHFRRDFAGFLRRLAEKYNVAQPGPFVTGNGEML